MDKIHSREWMCVCVCVCVCVCDLVTEIIIIIMIIIIIISNDNNSPVWLTCIAGVIWKQDGKCWCNTTC